MTVALARSTDSLSRWSSSSVNSTMPSRGFQTWNWVIGSPGQWVIWVIFHVRVTGSSFWTVWDPSVSGFRKMPKIQNVHLKCWNDKSHYHGLRGSASPVLMATGFVNGRWQFSTPHRINTPWPITKKFGTCDYVGGPYSCAKFGANPSMRGFLANGWNITKFFFIYLYLFF